MLIFIGVVCYLLIWESIVNLERGILRNSGLKQPDVCNLLANDSSNKKLARANIQKLTFEMLNSGSLDIFSIKRKWMRYNFILISLTKHWVLWWYQLLLRKWERCGTKEILILLIDYKLGQPRKVIYHYLVK